MTTEQKIIWLSWYRHEDCRELFELVKKEMFPTSELGDVYELLKTKKLSFSESELDKVMIVLSGYGILDSCDTWMPIFPENLRDALIDDWRTSNGSRILAKAHNELSSGGDYLGTLRELEKIEDVHKKKQSTLKDHFEDIANDYMSGTTKGIPTGIEGVDEVTERLKKGHFWVIAAATNTGKTTLTLQIARSALMHGARVDFVSLEMSARQLLERITWLEASMSRTSFEKAIGKLIDLPLTVTESIRTVDEIKAHIENSEADLIVLDYIQLVRGGKSYFDEATLASNMLQEMAIKKMIPIIALSQVTKESTKAGPSMNMDFKNSGAIAESADVAIEIYRDREGASMEEISDAILAIKKNRHGRISNCQIQFDNKRGYFVY